ncbi:hypothetical protein D3C84_675590 [compost metagenome]
MNAEIDLGIKGRRRCGHDRFGQGVRLANVVAGTRTGFQDAIVLKLPAHLHRGRQADGVFFHHQPNGGEAFPGFQGAAADRVEVVVG